MKILAIDDEALSLEGLTDAIRKACPEADLHAFQSARDALRYASRDIPDIAFLDIEMRDMSGIETASELLKKNPKINIITKSLPQELVIEDNAIKGLVIKNVETGELSTVECAGIFPYMGADPATGFLKNLNILDERGYIVVNKDMETAVPGIYGAGDVTVKDLGQVVTATNDGAIAANACVKYLNR